MKARVGDTIYPCIVHRHFTWAISLFIPGYCSCCASSYPDDPEKPGLSCPDWLRPNDPALACCACHCSWKPSSDGLRDSTMGHTFLWARYGFCKDPRLSNNSPPLEYFVSYTLGWPLPTPRLSLVFFVCVVFSHIVSGCCSGCISVSFPIMWLASSLSTLALWKPQDSVGELSFLLTVSFCFPPEMYNALLFLCRHCDFFCFG